MHVFMENLAEMGRSWGVLRSEN